MLKCQEKILFFVILAAPPNLSQILDIARPYSVLGQWRSKKIKNSLTQLMHISTQLLKVINYVYFRPLCKFTQSIYRRYRRPFSRYLAKTVFSPYPNLEMIGKDVKINHLYLKSKTTFITFFRPLSKLAEQVKIHLM